MNLQLVYITTPMTLIVDGFNTNVMLVSKIQDFDGLSKHI